MEISRVQLNMLEKKRRKRRMTRLITINTVMLAVIAVLGTFLIFYGQNGLGTSKTVEMAPTDGNIVGSTSPISPTENPSVELNQATEQATEPEPSVEESPSSAAAVEENAGNTNKANKANNSNNSTNDGGAVVPLSAVVGSTPTGSSVRLAFTGDIMMGSSVEKIMRKSGLDYPFSAVLPFLQKPDFTAGNLENPITKRGVPAQNKQYVFKGSPDLLPKLKESGFDVVTLANNHTLDQGTEGLLDTMSALEEAGLPYIGGGKNEKEAYAPVILEKNGIKIAYLGVSRVLPEMSWAADSKRAGVAEAYNPKREVAAIKAAKQQADVVVVMVHWGKEREDYPVDNQKMLAHMFVDAGADLIIGSHPHVLQGFENYKNKWIAYSLGNFIFNHTPNIKTLQTGVLDAVCTKTGNCNLTFHPMLANQSKPAPMNASDSKDLLARLTKISINAKLDKDGKVTKS